MPLSQAELTACAAISTFLSFGHLVAHVSLPVKQPIPLHYQACPSAPGIPEAFELASQACPTHGPHGEPPGSPSCLQVLLGYPYNTAIDMWSLGCMAAELFLGLPLFPGASEHDLLTRMVDMLGTPPEHVLERAQHTHRYFRCV